MLTGHTHFNSFQRQGGVTHITTGALSGLRWVLPAGVHERGYRLFLARERQLYSAWKPTGRPVLGWSEGGGERVAVAADRDGPFASVTLERDGAEVPVERLPISIPLAPFRWAMHPSTTLRSPTSIPSEPLLLTNKNSYKIF